MNPQVIVIIAAARWRFGEDVGVSENVASISQGLDGQTQPTLATQDRWPSRGRTLSLNGTLPMYVNEHGIT